MDPKYNDLCLYMRQQGDTETGDKLCEGRDKDGSDVTISLEMPGAPQNQKSQGRVLLWSLWREHNPADTLILGLGPPEP